MFRARKVIWDREALLNVPLEKHVGKEKIKFKVGGLKMAA